MKNRIAVLGVGSAGIQSLCHMLANLDNSWTVVSIYDKNIPNLGIGESTNPSFLTALENGLDFTFIEDSIKLDATVKLGTTYKNWREKDFTNPLIKGSAAIHFNTSKLKDFALPRLKERWGDRFSVIEGHVDNIKNTQISATILIDGIEEKFDYVIDCRGFPKEFTSDYVINEHISVNHALVHNIQVPGTQLSTGHRATKDGWMFEIPLTTRQSFGYMFNDEITSVEEAKKNFAEEINVSLENLDDIEYKFKSYYSKRILDKRILKNGNAAVFFEPMMANSLWLYDQINRVFVEFLKDKLNQDEVNNIFTDCALRVKDMISYNYHGGSNHDTEFWRGIKITRQEKLRNSPYFKTARKEFKEFKETNSWVSYAESTYTGWVFGPYNLMRLDKNFGYNYFTTDKEVPYG